MSVGLALDFQSRPGGLLCPPALWPEPPLGAQGPGAQEHPREGHRTWAVVRPLGSPPRRPPAWAFGPRGQEPSFPTTCPPPSWAPALRALRAPRLRRTMVGESPQALPGESSILGTHDMSWARGCLQGTPGGTRSSWGLLPWGSCGSRRPQGCPRGSSRTQEPHLMPSALWAPPFRWDGMRCPGELTRSQELVPGTYGPLLVVLLGSP